MNNTTLQIGQAYIVEGVPMVLQSIEGVRHNFTDGRYGFGRVLGTRPRHAETLANLKIAEDVNPQDILDKLARTVQYMANFNRSK
tara:strand:+ start:230 stop:484 length:255 start_codon:yes stop_codon:yes gene_type:complete